MNLKFLQIQKLRALVSSFTDRNVIELLRLLDKKKKILRITLNSDEMLPFKQCINEMSLFCKTAPYMLTIKRKDKYNNYITTNVEWNNKLKKKIYLVYISTAISKCDQAINKEINEDDDYNLGIFYGYPRCCVKNYSKILKNKNWIVNMLNNSNSKTKSFYNNKLAYLFNGAPSLLEDYFPCSLDCKKSLLMAKQNYKLLKKYGFNTLAGDIVEKLKRNIFIFNNKFYQFKKSYKKKDFLIIKDPSIFISYQKKKLIIKEKKLKIFQDHRENYILYKEKKCPIYLFK
jgi:hypothetical protein